MTSKLDIDVSNFGSVSNLAAELGDRSTTGYNTFVWFMIGWMENCDKVAKEAVIDCARGFLKGRYKQQLDEWDALPKSYTCPEEDEES